MKTLLIPVDFTNSSQNAIDFAVHWARKYLYQRIILLRSFYSSMYENMIMSADFSNMNEEYLNKKRRRQKDLLNNLCIEVDKKLGNGIKVQTAVTELPLVRSIIELIKTEQPQTILVGSDAALANNESFVAGNVIAIARLSPVRVLIVPNGYRRIILSEARRMRSHEKRNTDSRRRLRRFAERAVRTPASDDRRSGHHDH